MTNYVSQQVSSGNPFISVAMGITTLFLFSLIVFFIYKVINKK